MLAPYFDDAWRVSYTITEVERHLEDIKHDLVREALKSARMHKRYGQTWQVTTLGDIPGETGLGSSSALSVAMSLALQHGFHATDRLILAENAYYLEHLKCGKAVGRQDALASACGGVNLFTVGRDGSTRQERLTLTPFMERKFAEESFFVHTGVNRAADEILGKMPNQANVEVMKQMRDMAIEGAGLLVDQNWEAFAQLVDEGWQLKRRMSPGVTTPHIDKMYATAKQYGALGGKLCGAGGGGFMWLMAPPTAQDKILRALDWPKYFKAGIDHMGAQEISC
jgi:D-glycero-alpha-D-manno-heptose-7-phosphate kinase